MIRRILAAAALLAVSSTLVIGQRQAAFPHERHANLFPLCESCHSGIPTGDRATTYPQPELCARCHDGVREQTVSWAVPGPRQSNLSFSHVQHAASAVAAGDSLDCGGCHGTGTGNRMSVRGPDPALCSSCHAHQAPSHFARGRDCSVCHVPLVEATDLSLARVESFPAPRWHDTANFVLAHSPSSDADLVSCATCHARQTCTRCHLNEPQAVARLQPDPRVATIESGKAPEYPAPPGHALPEWSWTHAAEARAGTAQCANCHERSSCAACHNESTAANLPVAPPGDPRGVRLQTSDVRVHPAGWSRLHATEAASSESCNTCHGTSFCEQCHNAATAPVFHGPNYVARHPADAYAQESDCTSCHNPEVFCRGCHDGLGMGSQGRLGVAFHTSNPFWLVGHGVAARQGLEACASCHSESTCMQCHSAFGAWRINPHGPGFDPTRLGDANRLTCLLCHRDGTGGR